MDLRFHNFHVLVEIQKRLRRNVQFNVWVAQRHLEQTSDNWGFAIDFQYFAWIARHELKAVVELLGFPLNHRSSFIPGKKIHRKWNKLWKFLFFFSITINKKYCEKLHLFVDCNQFHWCFCLKSQRLTNNQLTESKTRLKFYAARIKSYIIS